MTGSVATEDEYDVVDHAETSLDPTQIAKIRAWLQPTDYLADSGEFRRHLSSVAPNTGLWICKTEEYQQWHDSPDHGSLWIKGVPGAGKSVVAASIIQHLKSTEDAPVLFFFFRNIVAANFSPRSLVQDWLAQLLPHSPKLQFSLKPRLDSDLAEVSDNDLIQHFLDGISCVPRLYCVADALDEMTLDNKPFLAKLNSLATHRPKTLKLLMTSRPKQYLQSELKDSSIVHVSLQEQLVNIDISSYLKHRFGQVSNFHTGIRLHQGFIDMVAERSSGLFLYAKLITDQIERAIQSQEHLDPDALLASLPTGLEETYNGILEKQRQFSNVTVDLQVAILKAVTHAARPLRLNEMASLVQCIQPQASTASSFKQIVALSCGPLIEILEDETLQVIHHSFTEFLRGETRSATTKNLMNFPIIDTEQAHRRLALSCIQYLRSGSLLVQTEMLSEENRDVSVTYNTPLHKVDYDEARGRESGNLKDPFEYREARLLHPFLSYSVERWSYHASLYDVFDEDFFHHILDFIQPEQLDFRRWLSIQWGSTSSDRAGKEGIPTGLHIAAFSGLCCFAQELLQKGHSVSNLDAQLRTPLHWAAQSGHTKMASLLIEHGADANAADGRGLKPIHLAASRNHANTVKVLLEAGVEPTTPKTKENHAGRLLGGETITRGECAIFYVSKMGHTEAATALVPYCSEEALAQLLCECCHFGRTDAVLAILNNSRISPDVMYEEATPLFFACGISNTSCVEALIERGADVNKISTWNPRPRMFGPSRRRQKAVAPLHRLVRAWNDEAHAACDKIFKMLLRAGVDLEMADGDGNTAIQLSTGTVHQHENLHLCAMRALIEAGADTVKVDSNKQNLLHRTLGTYRDPLAVRLLIEHGIDPNQKDMSGFTALHAAMYQPGMVRGTENTEIIVEYLLKQGADPTIKDNHNVTPVHQAMSISPRLFKLLLGLCNNESIKRECWFRLSDQRNYDIIQEYLDIFLGAGIDIETKDRNGSTLYLNCIWNADLQRALEERGSRIDSVDNRSNNVIHLLCGRSNFRQMKEVARPFLEKGVNPLARNNNGDTLLHHVAYWYSGEHEAANLVRWLIIDLGVPVNATNNQGATALHIFQERNSGSGTGQHSARTHFVEAFSCKTPVDFNIVDHEGFAALHLAAIRSEFETAVLVGHGADATVLSKDRQNAIHLACRARQANVIGYLLDLTGISLVDQRDIYDRTPLHYACSSGHPDSVAMLLKHGAEVHVTDKDGRTPLHACAETHIEQQIWATRNLHGSKFRGPTVDRLRPGHASSTHRGGPWYTSRYGVTPSDRDNEANAVTVGPIMDMLLSAGAQISSLDKNKNTVLDLALTYKCSEIVEFFKSHPQLLAEATKPTLDPEDKHSLIVQTRRNAQISLVRPKAVFSNGDIDELNSNEIVARPIGYLNFLAPDDIVFIVEAGLRDDSLRGEYHDVLQHLMEQGFTHIVERLVKLVERYSSEETLGLTLHSSRPATATMHNALQLACKRHEPNLRMLSLLVDRFKIDVDGHCRIRQAYDSQSSGQQGGTALHVLASGDHWWQISALKFLLVRGADIDASDEQGRTPLHIAAVGPYFGSMGEQKGFWRVQIVKTLLDFGADPNILDADEETALHKSSCFPEIMTELLQRGANPKIGQIDPLFLAIYEQNVGALEVMLDQGSSPNSVMDAKMLNVSYKLTDNQKRYALLCASFAGKMNTQVINSTPLIKTLIERGADLYVPLNEDDTLAHFLFEIPDIEVIDTLLKEPCVSYLDFDRRDQRGRTILMANCNWSQTVPGYDGHRGNRVVGPPLRILDYGADPTLVDNEGKTALHHLLDNPDFADGVIKEFVERDEVEASLLIKDAKGFTPLHYALRVIRPDICAQLLSKGADLLEPDPNGLTALHHLANNCIQTQRARRGYYSVSPERVNNLFEQSLALWNRFIKEGGSINARDNAGNTPLHVFVSSKERNYLRNEEDRVFHEMYYDRLFTPNSGVDVQATNDDGETVLHVIAKRPKEYSYSKTTSDHDKNLFHMMMRKGLDPLKEDAKGRSALDVASACEKDDIVALFGRK